MSEEIITKLDALQTGLENLRTEILARFDGVEGRLRTVEKSVGDNYRVLVDLQKSTNDKFETVTDTLMGMRGMGTTRRAS